MFDGNFLLSCLNLLVAVVGVLFVMLAITEYTKLKELRDDFRKLQKDFKEELFKTQKAMQRVIASYSMSDSESKIRILTEAVDIDPQVFNGYNSLGYAYLEKGDTQNAIDAFNQAIKHHPSEKAGYFDLAMAHLRAGNDSLCLKYLRKAISVDPTSRRDLLENPVFEPLKEKEEFCQLLH